MSDLANAIDIFYTDSGCVTKASAMQRYYTADCTDMLDTTFNIDDATCFTYEGNDNYLGFKSFCTANTASDTISAFQNERFILYDVFNDSSCADYYYSYGFTVGSCVRSIAGTDELNLIASLNDDADTGSLVYYEGKNCSTESWSVDLTATILADATCEGYEGNTYYYKYYTKDTIAGDSSSSTSASSGSTSAPTTAPTTAPTSSSGVGTGAIIGIIAGAVAVVILLAALVFWCRRRNSNHHSKNEDTYGQVQTVGTTGYRSTGPGNNNQNTNPGLWDDEDIVSWRIPREKVQLGPLLSRGGYGEVYKGSYNGQHVAIKMLLPETRRSVKHVNAFLAEVKMMAVLEHACVVQFIGVAWDSFNDLCVVSEFMNGGDLRALLVHYEQENHPRGFDYHKVKIAYHIAHALTYLHSLEQPVIHRDLKSKNVLLDDELNAKLTDFGISRERADRTMTAGVGTSLWMAPEIMLGSKYGVSADMFSFGVLLSELDVHLLPYSHAKDTNNPDRKMPDAAILQMVAMGTLRVEFSEEAAMSGRNRASTEVVALGISCVATDPSARPTAAEALYRLQKILQAM